MKYFYQVNGNTVYCVAKYAGKGVVGVAKCNEDYDKFDVEIGKELAKLRCDLKVARKRTKRAKTRWIDSHNNLKKAIEFENIRAKNHQNCIALEEAAIVALEKLEQELFIG